MNYRQLYEAVKINEMTLAPFKDADWIYDKYFKKLVNETNKSFKQKKATPYIENILWENKTILGELSSKDLKSKQAQLQHEVKPITITCLIHDSGSPFYSPIKHNISLSIQLPIFEIFNSLKWDKQEITDNYPDRILHEIQPDRIKATILHELSHWMRDANSGQISKMIYKSHNLRRVAITYREKMEFDHVDIIKKRINKVLMGDKITAMATDYEMDAYIHGLKMIKHTLGKKKYNSLTLNKLTNEHYVSFGGIMRFFKDYYNNGTWHEQLSNKDKKAVRYNYGKRIDALRLEHANKIIKMWSEWQKHLISRMVREDILGPKMRDLVKLEYNSELDRIIIK